MHDVRFPSPASNFEEDHLWIRENFKQETATTLFLRWVRSCLMAMRQRPSVTPVRRCRSSVSAVITSAWRRMKGKASASCALRSTTGSIFSATAGIITVASAKCALAKPCAVVASKGFPHDKIDGQTNKAAT